MPGAFLGVIDIQLKTFSTTYAHLQPGISGWNFAPQSLMPTEYIQGVDGTNTPIGAACNVFDYKTGITKYQYGNVAGSINNSGGFNWLRRSGNAGRLSGFMYKSPTQGNPFYEFSANVTLGVAQTNAVLTNIFQTYILPALANTIAPDPLYSGNWVTQNGLIVSSVRENLSPYVTFMNPNSGATSAKAPINASMPQRFDGTSIPWGGLNYMHGGSTGICVTANFTDAISIYVPTITNPPGSSIDLNAYINTFAAPLPTSNYGGWLWINAATLTITGRTLNGFGIYMLPDGSAYYLLNFVPVDAQAHNWQAGIAAIEAKFDDSGVLWMHSVGQPFGANIYSSLPNTNRILEVFPPMGLPTPPNDVQLTLRGMRGYSL